MRATHPLAACSLFLCVLLVCSGTAGASPQDTAAPAASGSATATEVQESDNDAALTPAEPDFRVVNLPTTLRLPKFKGNFTLTHRFAGNLRRGSFSDQASRLFGLDEGAVVGFEYRFAVARRLQAIAYRSAFQRTVQFSAKYDTVHQGVLPISASPIVSVEGTDNFQEEHAPALGVSLSRMFGDTATVYAVPLWVHNSAAAIGGDRDTFLVGVGGRVRVRDTVYFAAEVSPRVSGYAPGKPAFGFAVEKRAGGHMFQLNFTNTSGTTFGQLARGGVPNTLYLGFNLGRKFF